MMIKTIAVAVAFGAFAFVAIPAQAQVDDKSDRIMVKVRGKMMEVHMMKSSAGTVMYAVSKADLERLMNRKLVAQRDRDIENLTNSREMGSGLPKAR